MGTVSGSVLVCLVAGGGGADAGLLRQVRQSQLWAVGGATPTETSRPAPRPLPKIPGGLRGRKPGSEDCSQGLGAHPPSQLCGGRVSKLSLMLI